jgi:hypothetical protein
MVADVGFQDVKVVTLYKLGDRQSAHGWWRAREVSAGNDASGRAVARLVA